MSGDYTGPRLREKKLKLRAHRRHTWARRKWAISTKGNPYLNTEGFNLTVFKQSDKEGQFWGLKVTNRTTGHEQYGKRRYPSEEAAKRAALDALLWAKDHLGT
jgi:hypothetical protein